MKLRVKSPYWTFFWCLPLIGVLGHDIFAFFAGSHHFNFSETGYLLQHYTPWHNDVVRWIDHPAYIKFLKIVFNAKAVLVAFVYALPALIWINRKPNGDRGPSSKRLRR